MVSLYFNLSAACLRENVEKREKKGLGRHHLSYKPVKLVVLKTGIVKRPFGLPVLCSNDMAASLCLTCLWDPYVLGLK